MTARGDAPAQPPCACSSTSSSLDAQARRRLLLLGPWQVPGQPHDGPGGAGGHAVTVSLVRRGLARGPSGGPPGARRALARGRGWRQDARQDGRRTRVPGRLRGFRAATFQFRVVGAPCPTTASSARSPASAQVVRMARRSALARRRARHGSRGARAATGRSSAARRRPTTPWLASGPAARTTATTAGTSKRLYLSVRLSFSKPVLRLIVQHAVCNRKSLAPVRH